MDYKQEIINLLNQINEDMILRYIFIVIRDIVADKKGEKQ